MRAESEAMTPDKLLEVCATQSVDQFSTAIQNMGWRKRPEAEYGTLKNDAEQVAKGEVDVSIWGNFPYQFEETLAYWISKSDKSHKACIYLTVSTDGYLERLKLEFGKAEIRNSGGDDFVAIWKLDDRQALYVKAGNRIMITIGNH